MLPVLGAGLKHFLVDLTRLASQRLSIYFQVLPFVFLCVVWLDGLTPNDFVGARSINCSVRSFTF